MKIIKDECGYIFKDEDLSEFLDATAFAVAQSKKPITNYDRLVSKSPEELAEFIGGDPMHDICPNNCHEDLDRPCKVCVLEWLKQESE